MARMICEDSPLRTSYRTRVEHVVSISVALNRPLSSSSITCWVGADERPAFILQNDLLANVWAGLGAQTASIYAVRKHHFNVIEDLVDPNSELTNTFVG